ncbi:MAG TPA: FG-GAP-like repeat-containing protein [Blastocatellia bacterium]|nr:FG-GAP-like repeat-containing protein [Blastocatellia bacterium]HMV84800.1 FG-GAP-like repeat-containing protein [Blastocatellia bacterium]HMY70667.1 FG-GAP-like repeat-containing protein [Blastocatellia bacterium]HNG31766.1 FG-GAP-like repeat-containing protein [Blastocatellia bacterium]
MNGKLLRLCFALVWPALVCWQQAMAQAPATPAEVSQAQKLFQAKDYDGAIKTLEEYFQRNPSATTGLLLLGNAYRRKGELDKALAAYLKAVPARPLRLQALPSAAGVQALKGASDEAFELLGQLRDSGAYDMELLRTNEDFKSLRGDARWEKLFPKPEDFTNPFVEPVKVIHEWTAETKGDQFSWIARSIGDVDGDKVKDIVTSAPTYGANGQAAGPGRVYVYSGKSGKLLWTQTGETPISGLGMGLEGAGDVNADGIPDVIAGAPGANKAFVYSGKDGKLLLKLGSGATENESFGSSASGAGDQNGDGYADVIVGAPGSNAAGQGAGRIYVFSGKDGALLLKLDGDKAGAAFGSIVAGYKNNQHAFLLAGAPGAGANGSGRVYVYAGLNDKPKFIIESDETGAALGAMFASVVGDVDGDKVPDVYASDFPNTAKGPATGRVYVHSGADGRRLHTLTGEAPGGAFGIGSADVGDVNKDGFDDLLVGAWQYAGAAQSGGKVYLYSGKDGSLLRAITCRVPGETFGFDATGVGDVDGDGVIDFLLTSTWSNIKGFRSGRMFVISGKVPAAPCADQPQYKQFDFWVGEWDVTVQDRKVADSSIQRTVGSCVIYENYEQAGGFQGKSFNFYDANLGKWRQTWVDATGTAADFSGEYKDGAMRYEGESHRANGTKLKQRMTVYNLGPNRVRQYGERSTDEGKTWAVTYDFLYIRKKQN